MAGTLVVNPGSSSKKYALYVEGKAVLTMRFERVSGGFEQCTDIGGTRQKCEGVSETVFSSALAHCLSVIDTEKVLAGSHISTVVVRVVVPGTDFARHRLIDDAYIYSLKAKAETAPLHIPHTLKEIESVRSLLPKATLAAASDSAFHATIPAVYRQYSLAPEMAAAHDVYRFGYHGLSVASVAERHHAVVGEDPKRTVVCHIGSGVSVTAILDGKSTHTTMGYSPSSGLMMASRAGDMSADALIELMRIMRWKPLDAQLFLSRQGGLSARTGTPDLRLVIERAARGEVVALEAYEQYVIGIAEAIAAATVSLGGLQSLIFTATAAERSSALRAAIVAKVAHLGIRLDTDKNDSVHSRDAVVSSGDSAVKVAVIHTDEMGEMYRAARSLGLGQ